MYPLQHSIKALELSLLLLATCAGCGPRAARHVQNDPGIYRDVTSSAGIAFQYDNDARGEHRFVETTGGGCAFLDFDNDGLLDLFAVQGGPAPGSPPRPRPHHALFRNLGHGKFADVTVAAGLAVDTGYGQGVSAADYDGDGWTDLLITAYGGVSLFHNDRGRFRDVTRQAGLLDKGEPHWYTSAAWADYDGDGRLDLFVCRYASWFPEVEHPCTDNDGHRVYCNPTTYPGDTSVLYHNEGGRFRDVSALAGLDRRQGRALGAVWSDVDGDGRPDLFVANDMAPNWLLRNLGGGQFVDIGARAGVAGGPSGLPLSGMGVAAADFNGDGREDLFIVNFSRQPRSYFLNAGDGTFQWAASWAGVGESNQPFLAFGVESLDYDLDGAVDLVVGNGHLNEAVDKVEGGITYRERQQLLHNRGDGRFDDDEAHAGDLNLPRITRGLAVGDYDNDGRPDILVNGPVSPLALLHNEGRGGHWVGLILEGRKSNRDAIGARITVTAGGGKQTHTIRSGTSYASHSDQRALFGLGSATAINRLEIRWPSGVQQRIEPRPAVDRNHRIREPVR